MDASVGKTVLVYLMLLRLASPALSYYYYTGNVTGVSLVGGSEPHEGTVQLVVASDDGSQPSLVTGSMAYFYHYITSTAICRTLGYPEVNRVFKGFSPYLADVIEEPSFHIYCPDVYSTVIGCPAHTHDLTYPSAVRCQTDGYLGCFRDYQFARPLATSPCPPGPNSDYSCIDRDNMTTESCLEYCRTLNGRDVIITYAGVRAGIECTCGVNTTELGNPSRGVYFDCVSPCSGDRNYSNCGGTHYIAAFNITSEPDEQEATTHAVYPSPDPTDITPADTTHEPDADSSFSTSVGDSVTPSSVTSEPDGQEATTHAVHPSPDPTDTTPADTTTSEKANGDSSSTKSVGNSVTPPSLVTSEPDEQGATTHALLSSPDPTDITPADTTTSEEPKVTSEPDEQEATTHAVHPSPDPTDTTPADTTTSMEPDGDSSSSRSVGNSVHNAGVGARVGAVIFTIMAGVNVYGYEWTRK